MLHQQKFENETTAAGAICPMPDCGALVVAYRLARTPRRRGANCEFICSRCGFEFVAPEADLIFQSVPRDWLWSGICRA